jgi:hypothetical protein
MDDVWLVERTGGGTWQWTQAHPAGPQPAARAFHVAGWDRMTERLYVFGGSVRLAGRTFQNGDLWALILKE